MPRLRRTSPDQPGWTRRRAGKGFVYLDEQGDRLPDEDAQRVKDLVIPPAWEDVWVTPYDNGHLQAVGTDDAGRRQYLYHPQWRARRDAEKFDRMLRLRQGAGQGPRARARRPRPGGHAPGAGLRGRGAAARPRLLPDRQRRLRRRERQLRADHAGAAARAASTRTALVFAFVGKSGVEHEIEIDDAVVVEAIEVMRRRRSGSDPSLLAYKNGRGWRSILPELVNDYVRESTGLEATAKDFRTWHATVLAAAALAETPEPGETKASRKRAVSGAMKEVASFLGNTPTLARSSYVDPRVVDAYERGQHDRAGHPAPLRHHRRAAGRPRAGHAQAAQGVRCGSPSSRATSPSRTSTRWSTPPTTGCAAAAASTARSTGPAVRRCSRTAGAGSRDGLATGDAGWTTAGDMPARWVIHVVGPNRNARPDRPLAAHLLLLPGAGGRRRARRPLGRLPAGQRRRLRLAQGRRDRRRARGVPVRRHPGRGGPDRGVRPRHLRPGVGSAGGVPAGRPRSPVRRWSPGRRTAADRRTRRVRACRRRARSRGRTTAVRRTSRPHRGAGRRRRPTGPCRG